jgi:hypothetical protein
MAKKRGKGNKAQGGGSLRKGQPGGGGGGGGVGGKPHVKDTHEQRLKESSKSNFQQGTKQDYVNKK